MIDHKKDELIEKLLRSDMDLDEIAKRAGYHGRTRKVRVDSLRKYCSRRHTLRELYVLKSGGIVREIEEVRLDGMLGTLLQSMLKGAGEKGLKGGSIMSMSENLREKTLEVDRRLDEFEELVKKSRIPVGLDTREADDTLEMHRLEKPARYDDIHPTEVKQTSIRIWEKSLERFDRLVKRNKGVGSKWELMSMALEEFCDKYEDK